MKQQKVKLSVDNNDGSNEKKFIRAIRERMKDHQNITRFFGH